MEEIDATNPKCQPLRVYGAHLCAHIRKTILLVPIHPFTRQIVPLLCEELLS